MTRVFVHGNPETEVIWKQARSHYEEVSSLGAGGRGEVYLATDPGLAAKEVWVESIGRR